MNTFDPWFAFGLAALATWRVTHLIAEEDGPADLILKLRSRLGTSLFGSLMDCFHCLSLWIAIPFAFAVAHTLPEWLLAWLALSGSAGLLERLGTTATDAPPSLNFPENGHDVLRSRQDDVED